MPREVGFLTAYDRFATAVKQRIDLPERTIDLLRAFLEQNGGRLSQRARHAEFARLSDEEVAWIEGLYSACFAPDSRA